MGDAKARAAYSNRQSQTTKNPHQARAPLDLKKFKRFSEEERILQQWKAAFGCPISDEAKAQFVVRCCDKDFPLADVRLWSANHNAKMNADDQKIHLEFFFDGSPTDFDGQNDVFVKCFEDLIQSRLQERRIEEFRENLATRRRGRRSADAEDQGVNEEMDGDDNWKSYLNKPVPTTELSVRSIREAGCMLKFVVCQTSISVQGSETLGQIAFNDHFPVGGVYRKDTSELPMPRWMYGMLAFLVITCFLTLISVWSLAKPMLGYGPAHR